MTSHSPNDARHHIPRRNSRSGAMDVELTSSNSTASLFLGAARRSWMSTRTEILSQAQRSSNDNISSRNPSCSNPLSRSSASFAVRPCATPSSPPRAHSPAAARPPSSTSTPPSAAVSSSCATRPTGMQSLAFHSDQTSNSCRPLQSPVTISTSAAPGNVVQSHPQISPTSNTPPSLTRSPATYSQSLPRAAEARLYQQKQQQYQRQLQAQLEKHSVSSLPSPDPTIPPRSRTSPISAIERYGPPIASPSTPAFPSPPLQQVSTNHLSHPRPNVSMAVPSSVSLPVPNNQHENPRPAQRENVRTGHCAPNLQFHSPNSGLIGAHARLPFQHQPNGTSQASSIDGSGSIITDEFYQRAKSTVDHCVARSSQLTPMAEAVEVPRLHLLCYACQERDIVYLALHQVYCLSSLCPADLQGGSFQFTSLHFKGLEVVRNLLVDNSRTSEDFLKWCVNFPRPMSELLKDHVYQQALEVVRRLLAGFVDCWAAFENTVQLQNRPPLVEDMVRSLGAMSVVLQYNIFLCLCRRIPNVRIEGQLQDIFIQDLDCFKRSIVVNSPAAQRARENDEIVRLYQHAINAMQGDSGAMNEVPTLARSVAGSSQIISVSGPATIAIDAQNTAPYASRYAQSHPGPQTMSGVAPVAVRSPVTVSSCNSPRNPALRVSTQRHNSDFYASPLQMTGSISPQVVPNEHQPMTRPNVSQRQVSQQTQQVRPQSAGPVQHPAQTAHMLAGRRGPHFSPQAATVRKPRQQQRRITSFLPPAGLPPVINTRPDPNRSAIHEAYLRDPVNHFFSINESGEKQQAEVLPVPTSFAVRPQVLRQPKRPFKWGLTLSKQQIENCVSYEEGEKGKRMLRTVVVGNQMYRLRCIKVQQSILEISEHSWCVAETTWPTAIYMQVNGTDVRPRRKMHNTRDLPLDITPYLRQGENHIQVGVILGQAEQKDFTYAMALEVITFDTLATRKALATCLPAAESQQRLCRRLARKPDDDDELSIVSDDLKINLVDPYTARLFSVPVRGAHCEHPECFDHETFLQTRILRFGNQSAVEADWRCPICSQDARPQSLVIDELLATVREDLERTDRCEGARSLIIRADGSWDVRYDEERSSSERPSRPAPKRKQDSLENGAAQRPKLDDSGSRTEGPPNPASPVVILD